MRGRSAHQRRTLAPGPNNRKGDLPDPDRPRVEMPLQGDSDAEKSPSKRMAGYRLGPHLADFDKDSVQSSPIFGRWILLPPSSKFVYNGRTFTSSKADDQERLMRVIMSIMRKNIRHQDVLRRARELATARAGEVEGEVDAVAGIGNEEKGGGGSDNQPQMHQSDVDVLHKMDALAVESWRTYRRWSLLPDRAAFAYNSKSYGRGRDGHDWTGSSGIIYGRG